MNERAEMLAAMCSEAIVAEIDEGRTFEPTDHLLQALVLMRAGGFGNVEWLGLAAFCANQIHLEAEKTATVRRVTRKRLQHRIKEMGPAADANGKLDHSMGKDGVPRNTVLVATPDGGFARVAVEDVMKAHAERSAIERATSPDVGRKRKNPFPPEVQPEGVFRCAACGQPKQEKDLHELWQGAADLCKDCGDAKFGAELPKGRDEQTKLRAEWERFVASTHRDT